MKLHTFFSLLVVSIIGFSLTACQSQNTPSSGLKKNTAAFSEAKEAVISDARQITFVGSKSGEGYFSPDGKWMIFQSERAPGNPFYQMYLMNMVSGETRKVSPGHGKTTCGWIHPSMKKVLYSSTHLDPDWKKKADAEFEERKKPVKGRYSWSFDDQYEIFESDLYGKNIRQLTSAKGYDAEASYSPDGKWIAFASNRAGYTEKLSEEDQKIFNQDQSYMMDIYLMKADGTQVRRLTTSKGYDGGPFFSADGKKITWRRFSPNGSTAEIFTMNVDGSEQTQVTRLGSMSWAPYFHPSGDYLIFGSSVLGYSNFELFIVDAAGKKDPVRVTFNEGFDGLPVFSPSGDQLSWTLRNEKGESQIYLAQWDDAKARSLLGLAPRAPQAQQLSPELKESDLKNLVNYLASAEMAGRATGSAEEKVYTAKLVELFKAWGLKPAQGEFIHPFEFTSGVELGTQNSFEFVGAYAKKLKVGVEYLPLSFSKSGIVREAPLVFAGYGIKAPASDKLPSYDSYKGIDVQGKWVVVLNDLPQEVSPERRHQLTLVSRPQHKVTVAKNAGAVGIIFVNGPQSGLKENLSQLKFEGSLSETSLAVLKLKQDEAFELVKKAGKDLKNLQLALDKGEQPDAFIIPSTYLKSQVDLRTKKSQGLNVVAKLEVPGAKSSILLGAHGDHLGYGQMGNSLATSGEQGRIHYGADDNASGVAALMELAHHFAAQKQGVKKNIYFAVWSGEEVGVLGSNHFAKNWKGQPFEAYLNMDMIGRLRDRLYVQGVGSGDNWAHLGEEIALRTAIPLSLQEDPYLPTDAMALYLAGVPSLSFFTGAHSEYHSPRDTPETLNYPGLLKVTEVVKTMTSLLTDSSQKMVNYIKVQGDRSKEMSGRSFRTYLGTVPDYSQEGVKGVRISGASKDSPAEKAGLQAKDIIVEFNNTKIENLYDYVYTLQAVKPNVETSIKVNRGGEIKELKITPLLKE